MSSARACPRIMSALEELAAAEAASLAAGDFDELVVLQARAEPLVAHLGEHGPALGDASLLRRVAAWVEHRRDLAAALEARVSAARTELRDLESAQRRVRRVAPAYGQEAGGTRRLSQVG